MTKITADVTSVFSQVTTPQVTEDGLENFAAILADEEKTIEFFAMDTKKVVDFLNSLSYTNNNKVPQMLTEALSTRGAVWGLAQNGHAEFVVETLNKLNDDHVTQILSAPFAVWGLADNGYGNWVRAKQAEIAENKQNAAQVSVSGASPPPPPPPSGMG
jgi:predicted lactoylglutathione lyase